MKNPKDPLKILEEAGCEEKVIKHCIAVRDLAVTFAEKAGADIKLVEAGAILHDIGRCKTHSIAHGQTGADICRELGLSEEICLIVERHIGAGLTKNECIKEGLVPKDCIPRTLEEKIVAHADNLIKGTNEISLEKRLRLSSRLSEDAKKRIKILSDEIEAYR